MRIDAHQHFWTYDADAYPWIRDDMAVLRRDFGPADLAPLLERQRMSGSIVVQAQPSVEETRQLLDLARDHPLVRGVVGWVELCAPDVEEQLAEIAQDRHLVGIRHLVQDEADDDFLLRPDFRHGIACLGDHGLVYDLLVFPRHLKNALRLVRELPDQLFVLDHLAKPPIASGELEPWRSELRALAQAPNLSCKISGMVTEADWGAWKPRDCEPYLDVVFEAFGEDRLLYGSDWPVCLLAADYDQVTALVEDYASRLDPEARGKLFGENAARIYALIPDDSPA